MKTNNTAYSKGKPLATVESVEGKQDKLTAGDNITIENNVISSSGGGGGSWVGIPLTLTGAYGGADVYSVTEAGFSFSAGTMYRAIVGRVRIDDTSPDGRPWGKRVYFFTTWEDSQVGIQESMNIVYSNSTEATGHLSIIDALYIEVGHDGIPANALHPSLELAYFKEN